MFNTANLSNAMRAISASLQTPVIIVLLFLVACTIILLGSLLGEYFTEHRYLTVQMPKMIDALRACRLLHDRGETYTEAVEPESCEKPEKQEEQQEQKEQKEQEEQEEQIEQEEQVKPEPLSYSDMINRCIERGGLLKRQKRVLTEITLHPELTDSMREALAVQLLEVEQSHYDTIVKLSEMVVRLGPVFGLLGTLIPLGPGLIALGQGDTYSLSQSLLIAFDTTVIGLISAAGATIVSTIRKKWYGKYMSVLEALTECLLEVEKNDEPA